MGYRFKYKPSRSQAREFAQAIDEIREFCYENGISNSLSSDSYYFTINGQNYRVSNHSVESSKVEYHPNGREKDVIYIHASKTRIREIYNDLKDGYKLDGRGRRIG